MVNPYRMPVGPSRHSFGIHFDHTIASLTVLEACQASDAIFDCDGWADASSGETLAAK
jgi:hypothetical protein